MARARSKNNLSRSARYTSISETDRALFRQSIENVVPLASDRIALRKPRPKPNARHTLADDKAVLRELANPSIDFDSIENGDQLQFARPGFQISRLRKLKRGCYSVEAELDLHGLTVQQAQHETAKFIQNSRKAGFKCVRIIHGKGNRSKGNIPKIKQNLDRWLRQWDAVLAYSSARTYDGGTGALYVLLRN
ncbi:MAG TPA: DNA mismatch repair protein MutS [Gammaproteobacteria bacterium]|nr:DNA mismatch repair protein MutS [Gammaproteobacteria bacterium]